ncbi:ABC transporter, ATP-binding protein [Thermogutta terrifontis]|jgi:ABC-2 type transport system ATP-binding protein|uniref:ABC transporter, ATP-binding protein n=1 Tax=Thermogutta terrifontis TaxID=1331910 RepID=A0A286RJS4_9BACT|nr:ABC transporter ATP-binding protein [Thermogutta terrifontis]ASV76219.1 ABC transporter, ATP-binding protein [Thermogutta terrifontis]
MIDFWNVSKRYGEKLAVSQLDLHIPPGEVFAFLGPNGAGKTTTIRMLVGLLRPTEGRVSVCGYDATGRDRLAAQCIGYVPDQPYLYDKLTGREFLEFVGQLRGLSRRELAARIEREVARFEIGDFLDELTETYSHGMRQRVVFAAAVLHDPKVIVLDEPTVGLDPRSTKLVKDLLRERAAAGTAVFMSTHTLSIAEEIADRIGIIHHGKLIFVGTVEELRSARASDHASLEEIFLQLTAEERQETNSFSSPAIGTSVGDVGMTSSLIGNRERGTSSQKESDYSACEVTREFLESSSQNGVLATETRPNQQ